MKKLFIGLFVLLGLFSLAACQLPIEIPGLNDGEDDAPAADEFDQNENEFVPENNMWIIGSHFNSWDPATIDQANPSCKFVKDEASSGLDTKYVYTVVVTQDMIDSWCGFKFIAQNDWSPAQFGMEDVDFEKSNEAFLNMIGDVNEDGKVDAQDKYFFHEGTSNRNNVVITAPGTYVIEYYPYNFASEEVGGVPYSCKFAIQFTPAA